MPETDIGAVADAITETASLVKDIADKPHPLIEALKMFLLLHKLVKFCRRNAGVAAEDLVGATCYTLPPPVQAYIIHVVKQRLHINN